MSARIFLIRHAAHDNVGHFLAGRTPGIHLGPAGRAQARRIARRMSRERIDIIQTSPVTRARETAQAIAEETGCSIQTAMALEEIDFGAWSGMTFSQLEHEEDWRRWNCARSISRTPSGETMLDVQHRIATHVFNMARDHAGERIAMVSHADPIRAVLALVLGFSLDRLTALDIAPGSISILDVESWGTTVRLVNETIPEEDAS